jgi:hypothetical protein
MPHGHVIAMHVVYRTLACEVAKKPGRDYGNGTQKQNPSQHSAQKRNKSFGFARGKQNEKRQYRDHQHMNQRMHKHHVHFKSPKSFLNAIPRSYHKF